MKKIISVFYLFTVALLGLPTTVSAYIGPGAGFAFFSSFFILFATFLLALLALILLPVRVLLTRLKRKKGYVKSEVDRVVVLGLDGLDPKALEEFMKRGYLKNFSKLKELGSYRHLQTTIPSISPVAWSSFITGVNPGRHNIFDFLGRDPKSYLPYLSSVRTGKPSKTLSIGKYAIPLGSPQVKLLRKGKPFWNILGEKGISSSILRVPITFPPEKFSGRVLSAMGVPDLRGSQGTFSYYTTDKKAVQGHMEGRFFLVERAENKIHTFIEGPENTILKKPVEIKLPLTITLYEDLEEVELEISGQTTRTAHSLRLKKGQYSDWIRLTFKLGLGMKIHGICRFYLRSVFPEFGLYLSPINIDPENPALPISHPFIYSIYLAKVIGSYTTLGLAEDTWALNEGALDEKAFLEQAYLIHEEREKMFFHELEKIQKGLCVCVFDATDRIQHMFWRYFVRSQSSVVSGKKPASSRERESQVMNNGQQTTDNRPRTTGEEVILDLYQRMDDLLGRVMERIDEKTVLIVMSDHGFSSFGRGVNLNTWLYENGYLFLKENTGSLGGDWLKQVDWRRTRAYALGLAGMYINLKGRESMGIVKPGEEFEELKKELILRLSGLKDEETGEVAIRKVYSSQEVYAGPYIENAPDLIIGYNRGYRASWESVTGRLDNKVFKDNTKSWGGDHCIDPQLVPGVLLCNRPIQTESPRIVDIAPTILKVLGVEVPSYFDGKSLVSAEC